jgi:hypothetical protein
MKSTITNMANLKLNPTNLTWTESILKSSFQMRTHDDDDDDDDNDNDNDI